MALHTTSGDSPQAEHEHHPEEADLKAAELLTKVYQQMTQELGRIIVGQTEVLKQVLIALFCQGHCILEGVPGLAKTLMISTIADLLSLSFKRIQFTPDLMPSDITGTELLEEEEGTGRRRLRFVKGPIFGHVILGDEINRTPPKTQAALLQAMQEYKVTAAGVDYVLEKPFLVLGTQNPIEQEGTYPLPEAQLDRFMFKILVGYPSFEEEVQIAESTTAGDPPRVDPVLAPADVFALRKAIDDVYLDDKIKRYIVDVVHATRRPAEYQLDMAPYIQVGASPRATIFLARAARAQAFLDGRAYVTPQDVKSIGADVLRHRVSVTYEAEAEEITAEALLQRIFNALKVP